LYSTPFLSELKDQQAVSPLLRSAKIAIRNCALVKRGEKVLVIVDAPKREIGYALFSAAKEAGAEAVLIEITPGRFHGEEPSPEIAWLMKKFDVILAPTSKSLSHTKARREASRSGARIATLPDIWEETFLRALNADYRQIARRSQKLAEVISKAKSARVTTPSGTDLTIPLQGRRCKADTGILDRPGLFCNLPAGEAYIAPPEGKVEGVAVIDGAMSGVGILKKPIKIVFEKGYAVKISGGEEARRLRALLRSVGDENAYNFAELGIGTNDKAKLCGSVLEDEKVMGTIHVALGDNKSMGGRIEVPSHLDGMMMRPTLRVDDNVIMKQGRLEI
jgi:leucyl aminopeptidase (aminopeptidase T)